MPMAALFLLNKASTTTTVLRHILHHRPLASTIPRFLCTSSSSSSSSSGEEDNKEDTVKDHPPTLPTLSLKGPPRLFAIENPVQVKGRKQAIEVDETKEGMLVRVTLPGVNEEGCEIFKVKNIIYVVAESSKGIEALPRKYAFSLEFNPDLHDAEKASSKIKYGILSLTIPKVGGKMEEQVGEDERRRIVPYVFEDNGKQK